MRHGLFKMVLLSIEKEPPHRATTQTRQTTTAPQQTTQPAQGTPTTTTDQADTDLRKRCGDNCAAATCKCQPERPDRFGGIFLRIHIAPPERRLTISKQSEAEFVDHQFTTHCRRQDLSHCKKTLPSH